MNENIELTLLHTWTNTSLLTFRSTNLLLGVEQEERDKDDSKSEELEETHTDKGISEKIFLHGRVSSNTNDQSSEELSDALSASTNGDNSDGAAKNGSTSIAHSTHLRTDGARGLHRHVVTQDSGGSRDPARIDSSRETCDLLLERGEDRSISSSDRVVTSGESDSWCDHLTYRTLPRIKCD